jgi:hypothetical protein
MSNSSMLDIKKISYGKLFALVIYLIMMYILIQTYYYLVQIDNCECFNKNDKYSVNVEFMKFYQILEIILLTIFVFIGFINSSKTKILIPKMSGLFLSTLTFVLLLGISSYMSYNTFSFYMNVKQDCKCVNSWYKYFVYFEGITTFITSLRMIFMILLTFIVLILFYNQFS